MGSSGGSTLDLDFSAGAIFADKVFNHCGRSIHPTDDSSHFIMVVSFSGHIFRLEDDSVAAALESAIGGSAIEFSVQLIRDKVFSFLTLASKLASAFFS